jgi:DNA-binding NarL/FixJ family response regulator
VNPGPKILIIEQEPNLLEVLELLLSEALPVGVLPAQSAGEAFSLPQIVRGQIGVIVLDEKLGSRIVGLDMLPWLRVGFPKAAVIVVGELLDAKQMRRHRAAGVAHTVKKPWCNPELVTAVRNCLQFDETSLSPPERIPHSFSG